MVVNGIYSKLRMKNDKIFITKIVPIKNTKSGMVLTLIVKLTSTRAVFILVRNHQSDLPVDLETL